MNFHSIDEIRERDFEGFLTISALQKSQCSEVPDSDGVYLVLRPNPLQPEFLAESTGGYFKGKNPTVEVGLLEERWIDQALVLNIGKAGTGKTTNLRSRLKKYMQFGQGKPVGHGGGRYIWQLRRSCDLVICWKVTCDVIPSTLENDLIREFETVFGKLPFANLRH